ncbi:MAG: hypothetical protein JWN91_741, partial [Nocardioides sp.]|nr:hypothetical protein [Nocardioides sp.]
MKARTHVLTTVVVLAGALLSVPAADAANTAVRSGHQRFVLITTDPNNDGGPIAANGVIHAKGTDVVISDHRDRFEFPDGNVVIRHHVVKGSQHESLDPTTCLFTHRERGTWKTIRGTQAYADVSGRGTYRLVVQGFGCDQ